MKTEMNDQRLAKLTRDLNEMATFLEDRRCNSTEARIYTKFAIGELMNAAMLIEAADGADPR